MRHAQTAGADPEDPSTFPAVGRRYRGRAAGCQTRLTAYTGGMVSRGDIVMLGITSGVIGCLVGGMMLGIGMDLIVNGQPLGWLVMLPGAPVSAIPSWLLARKLARQL